MQCARAGGGIRERREGVRAGEREDSEVVVGGEVLILLVGRGGLCCEICRFPAGDSWPHCNGRIQVYHTRVVCARDRRKTITLIGQEHSKGNRT